MADLPTPDDLAETAQASLRVSLDPEGRGLVDLRAGSRLDAFVSVGAALGTRVGAYAADRAAAGRLASSVGEDLDQLAKDFFFETRKVAVAATGLRRFTRTGGTAATTIPRGTRVGVPATSTQPAVVFEATETVAVAALATSVDVPLRCAEAGPLGNLTDPALVSAILDPLPATTPASTWSLTATPGAVFGGGAALESDDELKSRLGQYDPVAARIRGTRDAILAGALRVPGVRWVTLVEPGNGTLALFVGDAAFGLPAALAAAVGTELLGWRCYGVPVLVGGYTVTTVTVAATLRMTHKLVEYDQAAVRAAGVAAVKAYFERRPFPDEYFRNAIEAALFRAHDEVQEVELATPAANVLRPADAGYGALAAGSAGAWRSTPAPAAAPGTGPFSAPAARRRRDRCPAAPSGAARSPTPPRPP